MTKEKQVTLKLDARCALDTDINEILKLNYEKLSARYPEGTFDVWRSENRKEGDV